MSNVNVVQLGKSVDRQNVVFTRPRRFSVVRRVGVDNSVADVLRRQLGHHVEAERRHRVRQRFAVRNFDGANVLEPTS